LLVREVIERWPGSELTFDEDMAKLSVVGIGLRTHTGVGEKMFRALAEAGINVQLINTSEIRICAVVAGDRGQAALERLNREFGR
jgi:aspartate kinase